MFFTTTLWGQSSSTDLSERNGFWSFHVKYSIPLYAKEEPVNPLYETDIKYAPLYYTTIGFDLDCYISEYLSWRSSIAYEYGNFSKIETYNSAGVTRDTWTREIDYRFSTHSLLLPLQMNYHIDHFSISAGVVYVFHFATQVKVNETIWRDGVLSSVLAERTHEDGDYDRIGSGNEQERITVELFRDFNIQMLLGIEYRIADRLVLTAEYRRFITENYLEKEHRRFNTGSTTITRFNPYPSLLSLGISYDL